MMLRHVPPVRLGLGANWRQFTLLLVINAFVGAMVGLERSTLPLVAGAEFGKSSVISALSFIAMFGLAKAIANLLTGLIGDRIGRRTVLLIGWVLAVPVPFLILTAASWWWIVAANLLLGASQGLAWSATVLMKIDLVGPRRRGLAMGLNESAGYLAVGAAALASGMLAAKIGLRVGPAYAGIAVTVFGLALALLARDTSGHARLEQALATNSPEADRTTWRESVPSISQRIRALLQTRGPLFSLNQAGLVNNLNDGMAWGLFPLLFASAGLSLAEVGAMAAAYPVVWAVAQLFTGALGDRIGRKRPIVAGMLLQGASLILLALTQSHVAWWAAITGLGLGTALVYPTLIAAVTDTVTPAWRSAAVGAYRFWRDSGYVAGAIGAGVLADAFGLSVAIVAAGVLTAMSGVFVAFHFAAPIHGGT